MLDGDLSPAPLLRQMKGSERIADALRGVAYPVTKQELIARLADIVLEVDEHTVQSLPDLVRGVPVARFHDEAHARRAVDARWSRIARNLAAVEQAERTLRE